MDPQQRVLLETSWEALEHAGVDPRSLRGSRAGVFVGGGFLGYGTGLEGSGSEGYLLTGTASSVISGRISYTLGLEGPAVTVDTACSSSLVALHLAAQALRSGEVSLALAGGVTIMATPGSFAGFALQQGLAGDGRCKSFGAGADGTGWGEGAGVLVLERLSDARKNGHTVLAVLRGSAVNQDGASNGLTAPNGPSQQRVIRAALSSARLSAADVDVVEAHGTGTVLGDPIEAQALLATYGQDRPDGRPLLLGSVKSNIAHTQAAAGIAGVMKMVLSMHHDRLPKTLHADQPSPQVDWTAGNIQLLAEAADWRRGENPRRAGVSAFGISGTNAHVIIEEAPESTRETPEPAVAQGPAVLRDPLPVWLVSGHTPAALAAQAGRLRSDLAPDPFGYAWSLATTRAHFEHRAVVVGASGAALSALALGSPSPDLVTGEVPAGRPVRVGFLFAGQGAQRAGMGRELYAASPVFAETFDRACALIEAELGVPIRDVVLGSEDAGEEADQTLYAQTGLFAVEAGLVALLAAAGVVPDAVAGHSVGEIAAAHAAGVLNLEDACRLVANRARLMQALPAGGAMAAVAVAEEEMAAALTGVEGVSIAAVNGPESVVISGPGEAVEKLVEQWRERGKRVRRLRVSHAFHSARMDPILDDLTSVASRLGHARPSVRWIGALTGETVTQPDASYWASAARRPVRYADAVRSMARQGISVFLEIGPDGTLSGMGAQLSPEIGVAPFVPLLDPTLTATEGVLRGLAGAHVHGVSVDWRAVLPVAKRVQLPTYAFQHERFWPAGSPSTSSAVRPGSPGETAFWSAVEAGDLNGLTGALEVDGQQPFSEVLPVLAAWRQRDREDAAVAAWRYRITWTPIAEDASASLSGRWLVVHGPSGRSLAENAMQALTSGGAAARLVEVDVASRASIAASLTDPAVTGVLSLLAIEEAPLPDHSSVSFGLAATVGLIQALGDAGIEAPLWAVTQGAVAARAGDPLPNPGQAGVIGVARVLAVEQPGLYGGLVDLPTEPDARTWTRLVRVLAGVGEDQVVIRPAGILGRRLTRVRRDPQRVETLLPGTTLITGGTGAIGSRLVRYLVDHGAGRVVLQSRSGAAAAAVAQLAADLAEAGAAVSVVAADVAVRDDVAGLLDWIARTGPALTGVMHTAGILDDGVLDRMDPARLATVLAPKAGGAHHLDELTAGLDLSAFVLFSSATATFGGGGQANYAAANAYLDALAENRRARGLAGTSLAWGVWGGGGMADSAGAIQQRLGGGPFRPMDPALALSVLGPAIQPGQPAALTVMDLDWVAAAAGLGDLRNVPLLHELPEAVELSPVAAVGASALPSGGVAARLAGRSPAEQDEILVALVRAEAAGVLHLASPEFIEPGRAFSDLGFDSLTAVELRNRLVAVCDVRLPATLIFDYPNAQTLAVHLRSELLGEESELTAGSAATATGVAPDDDPIVIVGMGCRYPGGVRSPEQLWHLLVSRTDAVAGFPTDRGWGNGGVDSEGARRGGFLYDAADFDPGFFGISPREALAMDPQQRLLLETSWEALENAGIRPSTLRGTRTGVFSGGSALGYGGGLEGSGSESFLLTGTAGSVLSGRVSYVLGLEGPSVTVDTACSSSLVTLHLAAQALRASECSLALAGGVTVMATPVAFAGFALQQGLAADGRCKSFGAGADGTGWGEGAGVIVLERLSDARRNGHPVLAVVKGSAVNQDGASNGLTAPNGPSQQRVIRQALASAGLSAADVDAVEAHGTGTVLGDPIEAQALLATYGQSRPDGRPLLLGSVKSNIAHTQAAAGAAGVMKMVLALRHGLLPASLHADQPSPHVDWTSGSIELLAEPQEWPSGSRPRRAGISAFGISGTNAHVVLEEAPPELAPSEVAPTPAVLPAAPHVWLVSARTANGLNAQAGRLLQHLTRHPDLDPAAVSRALVTTRSTYEHRTAVLGGSTPELLAGLRALTEGRPGPGVLPSTSARSGRVAFLFAGQGAQRAGMARELHAGSPVFAAAFDHAVDLLEIELGLPIRDVLLGGAGPADDTLYAQTGLFAVEVGLLTLLAAAGVTPDVVAGHSVGEVAAAYAAGVLSLADAARLVAARARLMQDLPSGGAMAAVEASEAEVVGELPDGVSVAAVNGPSAVVVSGDEAAVDALAEVLRNKGRRVRRLRVSHAFHSARMEPAMAELGRVAEDLVHATPRITWVGALDGNLVTTPEPGYWPAQARQAVRFADSLSTMAGLGITTFVEIGPDGTLTALGENALPSVEAGFVSLLSPAVPAASSVLTGLARMHGQGVPVAWTSVIGGGPTVELPTYAFQRQRYWPVASATSPVGFGGGSGSAVEAEFWAAIENGDLDALAELTDLGAGSPGGDGNPDPEVEAEVEVEVEVPRGTGPAVAALGLAAAAAVLGAGVLGAGDLDLAGLGSADLGGMADAGLASMGLVGLTRANRNGIRAEVHSGGVVRSEREGLRKAVPLADRPLREILPALAAWRREDRAETTVADWRYRIAWAPLPDPDPAVLSGRWLVVAGSEAQALADQAERVLRSAGADVVGVRLSTSEVDRAAIAARLGEVLNTEIPVAGVLGLTGLDETPMSEEQVSAGLAASLGLLQALGDLEVAGPLWLLTQGAVSAGEVLTHPVRSQVWGLGRVAAMEHPDRWGGLADLPETVSERDWERLAGMLAARTEDQIAVRGAGLRGRRLVRAPRPAGSARPPVAPGLGAGSVLITGGTGAIGRRIAGWLAERGARHVVLSSRSGPAAAGIASVVAGLAAAGTAVTVLAGDTAVRAQVQGNLAFIAGHGPALTGVVHTAGVLDDGVLDRMEPARLARVLAPKADGARHLDELTADLDLAGFVLFSSSAATFGGAGQGNYAAANAYLDALAENRRARGLKASSLAWGAWGGGGMAGSDAVRQRIGGGPMSPMDPDAALRVFGHALADDDVALGVMDVDWAAIAAAVGDTRNVPFLRDLEDIHSHTPVPVEAPQGPRPGDLALRLAGQPASEQERILTETVRAEAAAVLRYGSPDDIDADQGFIEQGFDSLTAVELRNRLTAVTGLRLPGSAVFDHPTPAQLARRLRVELQEKGGEPVANTPDSSDAVSGLALGAFYQQAVEAGRVEEAMMAITGLATFRPTFSSASSLSVPQPLTVARGTASPSLVCLPSFFGRSGAQEYARLAGRFAGVRPMTVLSEPGFRAGESLPDGLADLVGMHAQALAGTEEAVILVGHSSGGLVAHALARHLEELGQAPAGLVLIDTFAPPTTGLAGWSWSGLLDASLQHNAHDLEDDAWLTAMAHYFGLGWSGVGPVGVPTLQVWAGEPITGALEVTGPRPDHRFAWESTQVQVPGDHFSMLGEHVATTAQAVEEWIARR